MTTPTPRPWSRATLVSQLPNGSYAISEDDLEIAIHEHNTYPVLVEALEKAFDQSVARSDTRRKWTSGDQSTHETLKAALALAKKGAP